MSTKTLSRRRLLASVPAVAATMAPVAARALTGLPMGDVALLALGRKLEPLAAEIMAARVIDERHQEEFETKLASMGLKDETEYPNDTYQEERRRLCDELFKSEDYDRESGHREWDEIHDELFALLDDILDIQPTTLEGFTVLAAAIVTAHGDMLCHEEHEAGTGIAEFFRSMCGFLEIPIPPAA